MSSTASRKGCVRACERCRRSKVRCLTSTVREHGKCGRCYQADKECIFPDLPVTRQRQGRTDARIASLEKQIDAVSAAIATGSLSQPAASPDEILVQQNAARERDQNIVSPPVSAQRGRTSDTAVLAECQQTRSLAALLQDDCDPVPGHVDASILSIDQAVVLISDFVTFALPDYPLVPSIEPEKLGVMRIERPVLFFAILTAACRGSMPMVCEQLHPRLQRVLAEKVILDGQKSLELMQAMLFLEVWYCPPEDLSRLNFCQWINLAGCMALQVGLVGSKNRLSTGENISRDDDEAIDLQLEKWRAGLAIALSVSCVSTSLHQQSIFSFEKASGECLEGLEFYTTSLNDRRLIAWAKLEIIAERIENTRIEIHNGHSAETMHGEIDRLEAQFDEWQAQFSLDIRINSLEIHHLYCQCKLHELAMISDLYLEENVSPGFRPRSLESVTADRVQVKITPRFVRAVMSIVQLCHQILDIVCHMTLRLYLNCPTVTTVRALYAVNMLSVLQRLCDNQQRTVSSIIDVDTIKFEKCFQQLHKFLEMAQGDEKYSVPNMALETLRQLTTTPYLYRRADLQPQVPDAGHLPRADHSVAEPQPKARNDLEAVIVSSMPDTGQTDQPVTQVHHQQSSSSVPYPNTDQSADQGSVYSSRTGPAENSLPHNTAFTAGGLTELELMCMPGIVTGTNSLPGFGHVEYHPYLHGSELDLSYLSVYDNSSWV